MIDIDVIGTIYTHGEYDSEGNVTVAPVALPGYHVNATHPVAEWAAYRVYPATPQRVFGGIPNCFYSFPDQTTYAATPADMTVTPPVVPQSVSIRQGCQALEEAGLLATVEAAIAAAPRYVQIDWERTTSIDRKWPTLEALKPALGLTDSQIDALFIRAATL